MIVSRLDYDSFIVILLQASLQLFIKLIAEFLRLLKTPKEEKGAVPFCPSAVVTNCCVSAEKPCRPRTHVNNHTAGLISCSCNWPAFASGQIRHVTSQRWVTPGEVMMFPSLTPASQTDRQGTEVVDQGTRATCPRLALSGVLSKNRICD